MGKYGRRFDYNQNDRKHSAGSQNNDEAKTTLDEINKSIQTGQKLQESSFAPVYSSENANSDKKVQTTGKSDRRGGSGANKSSQGLINEELSENVQEYNPKDKKNRITKSEQPKLTRAQIAKQYGDKNINKQRVNFFDVVLENFLNKITKGNLDKQQSSFEIAYNRIMAEKHTKMVFQILELNMDGVMPGYAEDIRMRLKSRFPAKERGLVDCFIVQYGKHNFQNLSSRKSKNIESVLEKQYRAFEEELKVMNDPSLGFSEAIREEAKSDRLLWSSIESSKSSRDEIMYIESQMKKITRKRKTFDVIQDFQAAGGHCCDCYLFIEVIVRRPELLELAANYMREILENQKMTYKEILDLSNYQKAFGVASLKLPDKKSKLDVVPFITTSNITGIMTNFSPGIIRDKVCEIYLGNQVANNYRFDIGVTATGKAENFMLIAQTGAGKSAYISTSMLTAMDNPYMNIIIKDFKGGEYKPFANIFPEVATVISTGIDTGCYINTYVIPDYKKFGFDKPLTAFILASNLTVKTLTALATRRPEDEELVYDICSDIVDKVYRVVGVKQKEPSTYVLSNTIDYPKHTMYALKELMRDSDVRSKYNPEVLAAVHTALVPHFGYEGIKTGMYQKQVDLEEILFNNRIIIYDKGVQAVGGSQTLSESEIRAQTIQEFYIDNLFCAINRMKGDTTIVITEELQRQLDDTLILDELVAQFTGGRVNNIVNIGICSTAAAVFESNSKQMRDVRESLTGLIIGKCDSTVVDTLVRHTKISNIHDTLMRVSAGQGVYEHSFLFYSLKGTTDAVVTRMPVNQAFLDRLLRNKTIRKSEYNFSQ